MNPQINQDAAFEPNGILTSASRVFGIEATILTGNSVAAGEVLGRVTASGKFIPSLSAAADGSQTPIAIAAEAIDASSGDKVGLVYLAGDFNQRQLTYGTGHTADNTRIDLAARGIFVHPSDA